MDDHDRTAVRRFIFGAVIVILVVLLLWFIFFRNKNSKPDTQNTGSSTSQGQPSSPNKETPNPGSGTNTSPQTPSTQQQPAQLTNVGPGETTTIFAVATAAGAVGHYVYRRRFQTASPANGRR